MFRRTLTISILATWVVAGVSGTAILAQEPLRMSTDAFGTSAEIEVRDLDGEAARAAIETALREILDIDRLSDPDGDDPGGVGALNRAAGGGFVALDPRIAELLLRAQQFCIWSNGAYGPLGGALERLWAERPDPRRPPPATLVRDGVGTTECSRLRLRSQNPGAPPTGASLAVGTRVDLGGIARGFAVDRAVTVLGEHGVKNAWIEVGNVWRTLGAGPEGRGWLITLPPVPGGEEPLDQLWLHDQALVVLSIEPVDGRPFEPPIDQRTGVPARGVVTVVTVSELAVDAEPLASTLFILGHREGQMRLGTLSPRPSVYWLLGEGIGRPLEATYRWSELERVRRRR